MGSECQYLESVRITFVYGPFHGSCSESTFMFDTEMYHINEMNLILVHGFISWIHIFPIEEGSIDTSKTKKV